MISLSNVVLYSFICTALELDAMQLQMNEQDLQVLFAHSTLGQLLEFEQSQEHEIAAVLSNVLDSQMRRQVPIDNTKLKNEFFALTADILIKFFSKIDPVFISKPTTGLYTCNPQATALAITTDDHKVHVFRLKDMSVRGVLSHNTAPTTLQFNDDATLLAIVTQDHVLTIWSNMNSQVARFKHASSPLVALAFDPQHEYVAAAQDDGTFFMWQLDTKTIKQKIESSQPNKAICLKAVKQGDMLIYVTNAAIMFMPRGTFDRAAKASQIDFKHPTRVVAANCSPDGSLLVGYLVKPDKPSLFTIETQLPISKIQGLHDKLFDMQAVAGNCNNSLILSVCHDEIGWLNTIEQRYYTTGKLPTRELSTVTAQAHPENPSTFLITAIDKKAQKPVALLCHKAELHEIDIPTLASASSLTIKTNIHSVAAHWLLLPYTTPENHIVIGMRPLPDVDLFQTIEDLLCCTYAAIVCEKHTWPQEKMQQLAATIADNQLLFANNQPLKNVIAAAVNKSSLAK